MHGEPISAYDPMPFDWLRRACEAAEVAALRAPEHRRVERRVPERALGVGARAQSEERLRDAAVRRGAALRAVVERRPAVGVGEAHLSNH